MNKKIQEELNLEAKSFFNSYKKEIAQSKRAGENIVRLDFPTLSKLSKRLSENLLDFPEETLAIMEVALEESGIIENPRIRLLELPKSSQEKIRNLRAKHLDKLVNIEGIVRQTTDVRPQVVNAKFECPSCGAILSVLQIDRKFREPSRCSCQWKGNFKTLSKSMVDVQKIVLEESPDSLDGGEQPRRINVLLKEDLVEPKMEEKTTPGSRIRIFGILKEIPIPLQPGVISTRFDIAVEANNIIQLEETFDQLEIQEEDIKQILELAADPNVYKRLSQSISPSVYGYEDIKEAILLQIFGGIKKTKSDGGKTRGDIHVLLVGDPGVAKSVLLKFTSTIAPKGRYVSGKAATGAGLTAAVVKDEFLKGWSLEAGAMVLSNKGVVCIDEIEKMEEHDRSTMHEAMEQQCYHHDTIITLANGEEVKIGELVESRLEKNKDKIIEGKDCFILPYKELEVLTTDFNKVYKTKIDRISKHKAFNKFIKIKFSHGREITVTPEHPVFTAENGEIITKRADSIKIGDPIPIPLSMPIEGERQTFDTNIENLRAIQHIKLPEKNCPEIFKIAGYFISEGSREINRKKVIGINFTNKDTRLLEDFESCMQKVFNLNPYKQARIDEHGTIWMYRYTSTELAKFLMKNFPEMMKTSGDKQIPKLLMRGEKQNIAKMLSTMFEGDGYVAIKDRTIRIGYSTKSRRLAEQTQDLLLRFGIRSNLNKNREHFKVLITAYDNIKKFLENISFVTPEKNEIINHYLNEKTIKRVVKDKIPIQFNQKIIDIINEEGIEQVGKYKKYGIIYDHSKRNIPFSFSAHFLRMLITQVKNESNKAYLSQFINDLGWEKVVGIEIIDNEDEKWVYDITIEPSHSFVSQASILHNTISISKANIHATLRAETTVLAAGNPKLGRFDPYSPITQQIDISPALLSRFDVIFIIRDLPNITQDRAIATHVLEEHKQEVIRDIVEPKLLRKYVAYAKQKFAPKLTDEAIEEIKDFYVKLRNQSTRTDNDVKPIPITARQLEGIVRLSEAHAKMRLSNQVTKEDAKRAIELLRISLMQVGYDEETQSIDVDKAFGRIPSSQRNKIHTVREAIMQLESRLGKLIPTEELLNALKDKLKENEIEDSLVQLEKESIIFKPKKGYIQRL